MSSIAIDSYNNNKKKLVNHIIYFDNFTELIKTKNWQTILFILTTDLIKENWQLYWPNKKKIGKTSFWQLYCANKKKYIMKLKKYF